MNRLIWASLASSAAIIATVYVSLVAEVVRKLNMPFDWGPAIGGSFFFFLFGWPVALLVTCAVGIPISRRLAPTGGTATLPMVAAVAIPLCSLIVPVVVAGTFGTSDGLTELVITGAAAGAVGSLVFWAIARRRPSPFRDEAG